AKPTLSRTFYCSFYILSFTLCFCFTRPLPLPSLCIFLYRLLTHPVPHFIVFFVCGVKPLESKVLFYLFKIVHTRNLTTDRTLDRLAGVPKDKLVEAQGSFHTNHCIKCKKEYGIAWMEEEIFADRLPKCTACKKIVKPDIVFLGEDLPEKFHKSLDGDFKECELLTIMGTSLELHPFVALAQYPGPRCVRLLINRDAVSQGLCDGFR
ncbi:blast:NAD-dependent protein deacetylase Sirt2, partial [Drosophila guanche]